VIVWNLYSTSGHKHKHIYLLTRRLCQLLISHTTLFYATISIYATVSINTDILSKYGLL